tara:strand:+ start:9746 stop:10672 length:927 start_codon:yes stop_codon:yes gene_type:complete
VKKILVISSNLIGDCILSTGLINQLIKNNSESKITIVSGPTSAQVYKNFPNIENIIIIKKRRFSYHWYFLWKICIKIKWDIVIDLRSSLISYFLFKNKHIIFKHTNNEHKINQLHNYFNLPETPHPKIYNSNDEESKSKAMFQKDKQYLVIAPGGNWGPKIWPAYNFNQLSNELLKKNPNLFLVLSGSYNERLKYKEDILKNINNDRIIDIMGENITQTHSFYKKCNLFIGNDSGLMHLAVASGINTIGLFGPTNDSLYRPYGKKGYTIRTTKNYEDFKKVKIDKNLSYMDSITVKKVLNFIEINKLL